MSVAQEAVFEVQQLIERYMLGIDYDEITEEWARSLFSVDVEIVYPVSRHRGLDGLVKFQTSSLGLWAATHHIVTNPIVEVVAERASIRANLLSVHIPKAVDKIMKSPNHYSGTYMTGNSARTRDGWRLTHLTFDQVWQSNKPDIAIPTRD